VDQPKLRAAELQDGHYLLRSNLVGEGPAVLWEHYVQLAQIEAAVLEPEQHDGLQFYSDELELDIEDILLDAVQDWLDIDGPSRLNAKRKKGATVGA
jgi:hypothetical protein